MKYVRVSRATLWMLLAIAGGIFALLLAQSREALYVLVPVVIAIWICTWSITTVWRRDGELPVVDVGIFCIIFTTLYTAVPLLNYYFGGLSFGLLSDGRLQTYQPEPAELGQFSLNYIAYLVGLAAAYVLFRQPNAGLSRKTFAPPGPVLETTLTLIFLVLLVYFLVLQFAFGIGFRSGYGDESLIADGPLWLQQINGRIEGVQSLFEAAVLAILVLRKNDPKIRVSLFLFLIYSVAMAFIQPGSRGELFTLLILVILFWQRFYGIAALRVLVIATVAFLAFMFLGVFRSYLGLDDLVNAIESVPFTTIASATNEFQALFGTAFDVSHMLERGTDVPTILYFNDVTPLLPPQQFVPFQKLTGADWYLMQIDQFGQGVGFMWSVISQASIGFGMPELLLRGLLLGWFLSVIHRWYQSRYNRFLPTVIYVAMCMNSYWTFRDTTGGIIWFIYWSVIPFVLFLHLVGLKSGLTRTNISGSDSHNVLTRPTLVASNIP